MARKPKTPRKRKSSRGLRVSKSAKPTQKKRKPAKPKSTKKRATKPRKRKGSTRIISKPERTVDLGATHPEKPSETLLRGIERFTDALEKAGPRIPTVITRKAPEQVIWHFATRIDGEFNYKEMLSALDSDTSINAIGKHRLAFLRLDYIDGATGAEDGYAPTAATTWQNIVATLKNDFDPSKDKSLAARYAKSKIVRIEIWWGPVLS